MTSIVGSVRNLFIYLKKYALDFYFRARTQSFSDLITICYLKILKPFFFYKWLFGTRLFLLYTFHKNMAEMGMTLHTHIFCFSEFFMGVSSEDFRRRLHVFFRPKIFLTHVKYFKVNRDKYRHLSM